MVGTTETNDDVDTKEKPTLGKVKPYDTFRCNQDSVSCLLLIGFIERDQERTVHYPLLLDYE